MCDRDGTVPRQGMFFRDPAAVASWEFVLPLGRANSWPGSTTEREATRRARRRTSVCGGNPRGALPAGCSREEDGPSDNTECGACLLGVPRSAGSGIAQSTRGNERRATSELTWEEEEEGQESTAASPHLYRPLQAPEVCTLAAETSRHPSRPSPSRLSTPANSPVYATSLTPLFLFSPTKPVGGACGGGGRGLFGCRKLEGGFVGRRRRRMITPGLAVSTFDLDLGGGGLGPGRARSLCAAESREWRRDRG